MIVEADSIVSMAFTVTGDGSKDGFALEKEAAAPAPLALVVDGKQRDLAYVVPEGAEARVIVQTEDEAEI